MLIFFFALPAAQLGVGFDYFGGVFAPDDSVAWRNHRAWDACLDDFLDFACDKWTKRHEYVGVVRCGFLHQDVLVDFVVETFPRGEVLTEGVVGHEDLVFNDVGEHAVGPVKHGRFEEFEGSAAEFEFVTVLDGFDAVKVMAVVFDDGVFAAFRSDYCGVFCQLSPLWAGCLSGPFRRG